MDLRIFGVGTLVIECAFIDSKGNEVATQFILSEHDTCKLTVEYAEEGGHISMIDWLINRSGGVVTVENIKNFLNSLDIEPEMAVANY